MSDTVIIQEESFVVEVNSPDITVITSDPVIEVVSVGEQGPAGPPGANGAPGPNLVDGTTSTTLNGILKGNGSTVGVASNVAFTDAANTFTQSQTITKSGGGDVLTIPSSSTLSFNIRFPYASGTNLHGGTITWQAQKGASNGTLTLQAADFTGGNASQILLSSGATPTAFVTGALSVSGTTTSVGGFLGTSFRTSTSTSTLTAGGSLSEPVWKITSGNSSFAFASTLQVEVANAATKGLVVKGAASQSANLQEWQDSTGTALLSIQNNGTIYHSGVANLNGGSGVLVSLGGIQRLKVDSSGTTGIGDNTSSDGTAQLLIQANNYTTRTTLVVKSTASQTANLQEWQDSTSTAKAWVTPSGGLVLDANGGTSTNPALKINNNSSTQPAIKWTSLSSQEGLAFYSNNTKVAAFQDNGAFRYANMMSWGAEIGIKDGVGVYRANEATGPRMYLGSIGSPLARFSEAGGTAFSTVIQADVPNAATVGLTIKGASSQTANLQEWQDSVGSVLVSVMADGYFNVSGGANIGGTLDVSSVIASQVSVGDALDVGGNAFTPFIGDLSGSTGIAFNPSSDGTISISAFAGVKFPSTDDATAANETVYYSTTASKLVYKDSSSVVHTLY